MIPTIPDETRKLPKQFAYWARRHRIRCIKTKGTNLFLGVSRSKRFTVGCAEGVRYFRALPHIDRMDINDGFMDRWANSMGASVPLPKTQAEFDAAIKLLVSKSRKNVKATHEES